MVWFAIGAAAGAGVAGLAIQGNAGEGEATDVAASADGPVAGSKCPSPAVGPPAIRRVLVRVPASCPDEGKTEGKTEDPAWPASVPAAFRPEAFVEKLDGAAARHGVHVPYSVDCSEFPCMVIVEGPLAPRDNDAVMAWANGLHNPGGIPDADMWMFSNEAFTIFFVYPDAQRGDEVFRQRLEQRAREIMGRDDR